jgi:hypothetical protein
MNNWNTIIPIPSVIVMPNSISTKEKPREFVRVFFIVIRTSWSETSTLA